MKQIIQCELLEPGKFDAVEAIVGKGAHALNNMLTPLLAYPSLIKMDIGDDDNTASLLDMLERSAGDAGIITRKLLYLSSQRVAEQATIDLARAARAAISQWNAQGDHPKVTVCDDMPTPGPTVNGSGSYLGVAVQCLLDNAATAMKETGTIRVAIEDRDVPDDIVGDVFTVPAASYVAICVSDGGPGFPTGTLNEMFLPYATTYETDAAKGSGLGLSIVYRVARKHNGFIEVETGAASGTTMRIVIPTPDEG